MITHDLLERKGIHLSPLRINVMMNVAARLYLDSPEVSAVTNYPHRVSKDRALFILSGQSNQTGLELVTGRQCNHEGNTSV